MGPFVIHLDAVLIIYMQFLNMRLLPSFPVIIIWSVVGMFCSFSVVSIQTKHIWLAPDCFDSITFLYHHCYLILSKKYMQVVRSRLQEQGHHSEKRYSGVVDCIKKVFQQEGITGFYRGCAINLLRTTPAAVITFTSFEMIHRFLVTTFPTESHRQTFRN